MNHPNEPVRLPPVPQTTPPVRVVLEQGSLSRWSARLGWILFGFSLFIILAMAGAYASYFQTSPELNERFHSLSRTSQNKVAIINISGSITHNDGFEKWQIDRVREDESVKAVVLRVDSPGGTVTGSNYLFHHLRKMTEERNIPLVVSMGGLAASGGYYVSMAVEDVPDTIFAEPTTWTGSIGVIIPHYDISGLLNRWDIQDNSIVSHPLKGILSPTQEMTPEEREILQGLVDETFQDFVDIVKIGRPNLSDEKIKEVATGQIFTAKQALQHGLVDKLGFIEDAIDRAIELADLSPAAGQEPDVRVVRYVRPRGVFDDLFFGPGAQGQQDLTALLDLTAPRAYYLCTWLPTVAATGR